MNPLAVDLIPGPETKTYDVSTLIRTLRSFRIPLAEQLDDALTVHPRTQDNSVKLAILGKGGNYYGTLPVQIPLSASMQDIRALSLGLHIALHHPRQVDDNIYHQYAELTGWQGWKCAYCSDHHVLWHHAIQHEQSHTCEDTSD